MLGDGRTKLGGQKYIRRERGQGKKIFFCQASGSSRDFQPYPVDGHLLKVITTYTLSILITLHFRMGVSPPNDSYFKRVRQYILSKAVGQTLTKRIEGIDNRIVIVKMHCAHDWVTC